MDPVFLTAIWLMAMLAALITHAFGWRSWARSFGPQQPPRGVVMVPKPPEEVAKALAHAIATGGSTFSGRVLEADSHTLRARIRPPVVMQRQGRASVGSSDEALLTCHLESSLEGTRVAWSLDVESLGRGLKLGAAITLGVGAVAIIAAGILFPTLVIPSEQRAVQGQTWQVLQLIHFLWPPFLLTYQARRLRSLVAERCTDLMQNLPYV
ncbi:MAG: hypothetical protein ABIO70_20615 [Pseudomonadota bacterium]